MESGAPCNHSRRRPERKRRFPASAGPCIKSGGNSTQGGFAKCLRAVFCLKAPLIFAKKEGIINEKYVALCVNPVAQEVEQYKKNLERNRIQYRIIEQTAQPDGSVVIKIIKQYNACPVGDYLK